MPSARNHQPRRPTVEPPDCPRKVQRRDMFQFLRRVMWLGAMDPLPFEHLFPQCLRPLATLLDVGYELFTYLVMLHIDVLYGFTIYMNWGTGSMELTLGCMIQMLAYTWCIIIKLFFKRFGRRRVDELIRYINERYKLRSAKGFTYVTMNQSMALANKWTKAFVYSGAVGVTFWLLVPVTYQERTLPLPCWYPIDYKAPVVYEIIYFLQAVGQFQICASFSVTCNFFLTVCVLFCGQYDILNCSLKNIMATVYLDMRMPGSQLLALKESQQVAEDEFDQYFCSLEQQIDIEWINQSIVESIPKPESFQTAFKVALKSCVVHHLYILDGLVQVEKLYHFIWFFKTIETIVMICLVVFVAVKTSATNSVLHVLSLAQYITLVLWDMFIICYAGEIVFQNSQRCDEALLRSPWYLHMIEMKMDSLFFMLNAQRSFKLTAGKLYDLNLSRYRNILTTSFSFFALLQNIDLRNKNSN